MSNLTPDTGGNAGHRKPKRWHRLSGLSNLSNLFLYSRGEKVDRVGRRSFCRISTELGILPDRLDTLDDGDRR